MSRRLPRSLPLWLMARVVPAGRREEVLGDIREGLELRAERLGQAAATAWLWRELAALVWWRMRGQPMSSPVVKRISPPGGAWWPADLWRDWRYGFRSLVRQPRFSLLALLVFGLGIGAPATLFTLASRAFLGTPPEVVQPDRLVRLFWSFESGTGGPLGHHHYDYLRRQSRTLSGLMAYDGRGVVAAYQVGPLIDQLRAQPVSDNFFDVLGVRPHRGRFLLPEEGLAPGQGAVVVLSYGFWQRVFGGESSAVGSVLRVNGHPFEIVGVAPRGFGAFGSLERAPDVWVPIMMYATLSPQYDESWVRHVEDSWHNWLTVVGRMAPGSDPAAVEAELATMAAAYPHTEEGESILVSSRYQYTPLEAAGLSRLFRLLLIVGGMVLVVAAANVAGLLLIRTADRSREVGIRTAIGASAGRIVRQLVAENVMLGLGGCLIGLAIAYGTADLAGALLPYQFAGSFRPDAGVLALTAAVALLTAVLVSAAPAIRASRVDVTRVIREGPPSIVRSRLWRGLVVTQVGLSLVLVSGAVLFAKSFGAARDQPLGFSTSDRALVQINMMNHGYDETSGLTLAASALERLESIPGVTAATTTQMIPFRGRRSSTMVAPATYQGTTREGHLKMGVNTVGPDYFEAMDIALLDGRTFSDGDVAGGPPVVIINRTLAEALWPGRDAVGRTVEFGHRTPGRVIGVVEDVVYYRLGEDPEFQLYYPATSNFTAWIYFLVVSSLPPADLLPQVHATLHDLDPTLAFPWSGTLESVHQRQLSNYATSAVMVGGLSVLALILASTGLYGIVSFIVVQRTREIGIRMALGAVPGQVASGVLRVGVGLAGAGVVLGVLGAWGLSGVTRSMLFGIEPADPWVFALAALVLVLVTVVASLVPALRATKVDPVEAIRAD